MALLDELLNKNKNTDITGGKELPSSDLPQLMAMLSKAPGSTAGVAGGATMDDMMLSLVRDALAPPTPPPTAPTTATPATTAPTGPRFGTLGVGAPGDVYYTPPTAASTPGVVNQPVATEAPTAPRIGLPTQFGVSGVNLTAPATKAQQEGLAATSRLLTNPQIESATKGFAGGADELQTLLNQLAPTTVAPSVGEGARAEGRRRQALIAAGATPEDYTTPTYGTSAPQRDYSKPGIMYLPPTIQRRRRVAAAY